MTLHAGVDGAPRTIGALFCQIDGTIRTIGTMYAKEGGTWKVIYSSGAKIEFMDYPYPIPVASGWSYLTDGSTWSKITADGVINQSGTFTGYVKANNTLSLTDFYTETHGGARSDGQPLSGVRERMAAFSNGGKGYVCGGDTNRTNSFTMTYVSTVEVYDSAGNRTIGIPLTVAKRYACSFVNGGKGYVCGGDDDEFERAEASVDIYDLSGNKTVGNPLSVPRGRSTTFVNAGKAYVCAGVGYHDGGEQTVDIYDVYGNRTTGEDLPWNNIAMCAFVNAERGYLCGGYRYGNPGSIKSVFVYDSSGNRTTGTALSVERTSATAFTNGDKGYVCGGNWYGATSNGTETCHDSTDIYDISGNRTAGANLSKARADAVTFVNQDKGYVCGGANTVYNAASYTSTSLKNVDIFDISGNRTSGENLSVNREEPVAFVNANKGYVCGGIVVEATKPTLSAVVDVYADSYSANIPITEGSTYTLNGVSGVADRSKVLTYDSKVTGTIEYQSGILKMWGFNNLSVRYNSGMGRTKFVISGVTEGESIQSMRFTCADSNNGPVSNTYEGTSPNVVTPIVAMQITDQSTAYLTMKLYSGIDASGDLISSYTYRDLIYDSSISVM